MFRNLPLSYLCVALSFLSCIISPPSYAQNKKKTKPWTIALLHTIDSSFHAFDDVEHESSLRAVYDFIYKLDPKFFVMARTGFSKDLSTAEKEFSLINSSLRGYYSTPYIFEDHLKPRLGLIWTLPTNKDSRDKDEFTSSAGLSIRLYANMKQFNATEDLTIYYESLITRYWHDVEISTRDGFPSNTKMGWDNILYFGYQFSPEWSIALTNILSNRWTYRDTQKTSTTFEQELGYEASENIILAIGHTIGSGILSASGQDYDVTLFDSRKSKAYFSVTATF